MRVRESEKETESSRKRILRQKDNWTAPSTGPRILVEKVLAYIKLTFLTTPHSSKKIYEIYFREFSQTTKHTLQTCKICCYRDHNSNTTRGIAASSTTPYKTEGKGNKDALRSVEAGEMQSQTDTVLRYYTACSLSLLSHPNPRYTCDCVDPSFFAPILIHSANSCNHQNASSICLFLSH